MNPILANALFGSDFKTPPWRSQRFLDLVRQFPCCRCNAPPPSDPHHIGPRGKGQKTDDFRVIPVCRQCHDEYHAGRLRSDEGHHEVHLRMVKAYMLEYGL